MGIAMLHGRNPKMILVPLPESVWILNPEEDTSNAFNMAFPCARHLWDFLGHPNGSVQQQGGGQ